MKSILFINRVYPPVTGATGQLLAELAPELARAGWRVTVLTAAPVSTAPRTEIREGVVVHRVAGLPFTRASHWRRALSYLSLYPALLGRAWCLPRHDIVVTMTDPPLLAVVGWLIALSKRSTAVHWAQDLYPELAEELGVLPLGGWMANALRWLSNMALGRCHTIVAVGRCMRERLIRRNVDPRRIQVIPNWGHEPWKGSTNGFRQEHELEGRFVVMYSGNFGLAHPFEVIIEAISRMQSSHPHVLFLFVGEGPRLEWVKQEVAARNLKHVKFLPFQPRERLAETLGAADVHLATMESNLCGLVVPSKVSGVLAAGRACLFVGPPDSEAARLIREHDYGEVIAEASGETLAARLIAWCEQPERLQRLRERAPSVTSALGRTAAVTAFNRVLNEAHASHSPVATPSPYEPILRRRRRTRSRLRRSTRMMADEGFGQR
jgi:glycosyltransferase involved in cell wall biosynthesis